jgi:hypothetical protein
LQQALASGFIPDAPDASDTTDNRPLAEDSLQLPFENGTGALGTTKPTFGGVPKAKT